MATRRSSFHETSPAVKESIFSKVIIAPVLFVSFLISLFFIDRSTFSRVFGRKADKDTYYHSHQKKLAKHNLDEAFRRKNRIIAGLVVMSAVGLALVGWAVKRGYLFSRRS